MPLWVKIFLIVCWSGTVVCLGLTFYWLRQASKANRRTHEILKKRERQCR